MPRLSTHKKKELITLYGVFFLGGLFVVLFRANLLVLNFFYIGIPIFYLVYRNPRWFKKNLIEALAFSLPVGFMIDYIARVTRAWDADTIFGFKLLGEVTIEIQLWGILYTLLILTVYRQYFDKSKASRFSMNIRKYIYLVVSACLVFVAIYIIEPYLYLSYSYFFLVSLWFIVLVLGLIKYNHLFSRMILLALYFFPFSIAHEIISLKFGHWFFETGNHIGYVDLFNIYVFPIEELLWLLLVPSTIAILHEYFADNRK